MARIDRDDMTTLHPASECAQVASTAEDDIQLSAVAYLINNAANTGLYKAEFLQKLRPAVKEQLESNGYKLRYSGGADPESSVEIMWEQ